MIYQICISRLETEILPQFDLNHKSLLSKQPAHCAVFEVKMTIKTALPV
jgi:hypothetical protein